MTSSINRPEYERNERPTLTLVVDPSALSDDAAAALLAEYDRIVAALAAAASDELFPSPEIADGLREPVLRQMPMVDWIAHVRSIQEELERGEFIKLVAARRCDVFVDGLDPLSIVTRMAHDFAECTSREATSGSITREGKNPYETVPKAARNQ